MYCMEYIHDGNLGSHKNGRRVIMNEDIESAHPMDKKGKQYVLPNIEYQQVRKWVLMHSSENAEWEEKYQVYLQSQKSRGPRFQVEFTDDGQATGKYRAKYATIVGQVARTHYPPMYKDQGRFRDLTKDALWKKVLVEIDLPLIRKECTLRKLNTAWKQKKYELRQVYDKFPTDAERKRNVPSKVKKEEWEVFVDMCSTEEDKTKRFNGKLAREQMKNPHTTGRMGAVPVIGRLVSNEPDIVERDLDNDPVALVIGREGRGRVRGLGSGVTKTVYHASSPYKEIAQREKRARENSESGYEAIMARLDEADKAREDT
ncbi:hypothetical protein IFM89_028036 [Coptis chinensis]|uniref:Transposase n=1 Tax=Coptis chinensis TaxID=261450 RepID=A0A835HHK7_9MAGN|nr:hypothetical protein IFM89_028036 [Coptis chinensis]